MAPKRTASQRTTASQSRRPLGRARKSANNPSAAAAAAAAAERAVSESPAGSESGRYDDDDATHTSDDEVAQGLARPAAPVAAVAPKEELPTDESDDTDDEPPVQRSPSLLPPAPSKRSLPVARKSVKRPARTQLPTPSPEPSEDGEEEDDDEPTPKAKGKGKRKAPPAAQKTPKRAARLHGSDAEVQLFNRLNLHVAETNANEIVPCAIRKGHGTYVIYRQEDAQADKLDENNLGIGIVRKIKAWPRPGSPTRLANADDATHVKIEVQWLYRPIDILTAPPTFRSSFARNIKPRRGTWELIESAHIDEVDMESVVEPPIIFRFADDAISPEDAVTPLFELPDDEDRDRDPDDCHVAKMGETSYFLRAGWGPFTSATGASQLKLPKHCKCRRPYDPAEIMRRCSHCNMWWHEDCLKASRAAPGDDLAIRGGEYGVAGNWVLLDSVKADGAAVEPWRDASTLPREWMQRFERAKKAPGKVCHQCSAVI